MATTMATTSAAAAATAAVPNLDFSTDDEEEDKEDDDSPSSSEQRPDRSMATTEDAKDSLSSPTATTATATAAATTATATATVVPSSSTTTQTVSSSVVVFSPELLHQYYSRLFPFDMLHAWLSYGGNATLFSRREFSMTIEPIPGEEVYIRYQSFASATELRDAVIKRRPTKIDLGAIFSHCPKDHKSVAVQSGGFVPLQRELVFDIDLTDYDDVRHCGCSGANICHTCWTFVSMAVEVLDQGLKDDFGFEHVAWFYSGRRGVHAWVCDDAARQLTDAGRSAVANYFEVKLGNDKNKDVQLEAPLHPMLVRAHQVLEPLFLNQILTGHKLLDAPTKWNAFLDTIPDAASDVRDALRQEWNSSKPSVSTPQQKWILLVAHWKAFLKSLQKPSGGSNPHHSSKSIKTQAYRDLARLEVWPIQVIFKHTYPRLDVNVSKMRNHLLKSPMCVHPKTGRVCVPFLATDVRTFDPFAVPTLPQLIQELDHAAAGTASTNDNDDNNNNKNNKNDNDGNVRYDWQKTSLKPYLEAFQTSFLDPLLQSVRKQERDTAEQQAALRGDF